MTLIYKCSIQGHDSCLNCIALYEHDLATLEEKLTKGIDTDKPNEYPSQTVYSLFHLMLPTYEITYIIKIEDELIVSVLYCSHYRYSINNSY